MHKKKKTIDGTEITVLSDQGDVVDVSECPACGGDGMEIRKPSRAEKPWYCRICGYEFWLSN
jgi:predicted RNA-binding Zn-ribbon protein involved in translation (DUF1610 family)